MGERDLEVLLRNMTPELRGAYVFCTLDEAGFGALPTRPLGFFEEQEGLTAVLSRDEADRRGLAYDFVAALITLRIHSDLAAVGFLARLCSALAAAGISTNVISAYYHDHLFVPLDKADEAMAVLAALSGAQLPA